MTPPFHYSLRSLLFFLRRLLPLFPEDKSLFGTPYQSPCQCLEHQMIIFLECTPGAAAVVPGTLPSCTKISNGVTPKVTASSLSMHKVTTAQLNTNWPPLYCHHISRYLRVQETIPETLVLGHVKAFYNAMYLVILYGRPRFAICI